MNKRKDICMTVPYGSEGKSKWTNIGVAWENEESGMINLVFDAFPVNLSKERGDGGCGLVLVDPKPREDKGESGF